MTKRFFLFTVSILLAAVFMSSQAEPEVASAQSRIVLAHYYAWFDPTSFEAGKTPFTNPSPYFSTDPAIIQNHINQAQSVGIDGFVQAWYGPNPAQQTEPNFATLLNTANASGFKAAVSFESFSGFLPTNDDRAAALSTLLATHAQHPAYLRIDGKPVVYFWATWALTVSDWEYIRSIADPGRTSIWIAEGGDSSYLGVFDGMYLYNVAWSPDPGGINIRFGNETRAASSTYGATKYWAATAMPGFDDSLLGRGTNTIVRPRSDGAYFRASFSGAAASNPDMLVITSFNEWPEGSHIEPSNEFGDFYLTLAAELISTYKGGGVPASAAVPVAPPPQTAPTATAVPVDSGTEPTQDTAPAPAPVEPAVISQVGVLPTPGADGRIVYLVQPGDTLITIAVEFDILLDTLYSYNEGLSLDSILSVGQEIVIGFDEEVVALTATAEAGLEPTATATPNVLDGFPNTTVREDDGAIIYAVQEGNTIIEIALLYGLSIEEIFELNDFDNDSVISVGQPVIVGFVPTPEPAAVGGSADLPEIPPTETPTLPPTETPTATPLPLPTNTPTPEIVSQLPTAASPTEVASADAPAETAPPPAQDSTVTDWFLTILLLVVGILALAGGVLIYISRRL